MKKERKELSEINSPMFTLQKKIMKKANGN